MQNPVESDIRRNPKPEAQIGPDGECINLPNPFAAHASYGISRICRERVTICANHRAGVQRRHNLTLEPVRELSGLQQAERRRCEQSLVLPLTEGLSDAV